MKIETWIMVVCTVFLVLVSPAYWFVTEDPTGTTALVMCTMLFALPAFYLGFHASRMKEPRPEDRNDAEIADGAGELGFFPPYSWWPLWCALALSTVIVGTIIGWWLAIIGGAIGLVTLCGWVFEYYRGEHAH